MPVFVARQKMGRPILDTSLSDDACVSQLLQLEFERNIKDMQSCFAEFASCDDCILCIKHHLGRNIRLICDMLAVIETMTLAINICGQRLC